MSSEETTMDSKVETVDINLDEIFNGAPGGDTMTLPEEKKETPKQKNIFSGNNNKSDFSFADPDQDDADDLTAKVEETKVEAKEEQKEEVKVEEVKAEETNKEDAANILDTLDNETEEEEVVKTKKGRKPISGISDVFSKLIKDDKIVPFDDDKELDDYTAKDWEELIQANLEEKANQVRRETPKQFFDSLPQELQIAARYVADGGQDLKGLFSTLSQVEESKSLNIKEERDQEKIITEYLGATGYGTSEEIQEEIEIWKDLGKLEKQASKFKPKLDKMQEKVVARKLQEQELKKKQQEQASQEYMKNVYNTLKDGKINELKVDKKTQAMLYNGLVSPSYPSVSGRNTNLLGHLLEKYQFVEPNYGLISEALWLLQDPDGYKAKIMDKGAQKSVEATVRKLKTEQANTGGSSSLGVKDKEPSNARTTGRKKLQRANNIFKRI
jgi:hypothetical protein|tara:strand:- start:54 stop:1379 length:1326 start_codon:yes stop_codon:yes gene_type:complete